MQEKKIKFTDVLFVGLAFFASYFGAGNLIFPPMLGLQSGSNWLSGMIGMLASGVGLPILAIIVLGMCGSVQKISDHVNKKFYTVMIGAIMILCCCVSIPRTAAVGIEMGLQGIWPGAPYLVFVILYFVIAFLFAKDRGTALDKVGKILTPIMTIILFILVVKGAVSPIGTPGAASVDNAFVNSFLGGYSTGDVLVSFLAAGVFFDSIKRKGYEGEAFRKAHVRACLIAAVCLAIVYGGLLYMGACVSTEYTPDSISNANLLLAIIRSSGGQIAIYGLCLSVVLACLTTAISQITAVADFYETATHGKLSYMPDDDPAYQSEPDKILRYDIAGGDSFPETMISNTYAATEMTLRRFTSRGDATFHFFYDYGDGWEVVLRLEEVFEDSELPGKELPRVLEGQGFGIIEDCGGPAGLEHLREVFQQKSSPEYQSMREWLGTSEVDLSVFDLQDLNFRLKKLPRIFRDLYEYDYPPTKHSIDLLDRKYCKTN